MSNQSDKKILRIGLIQNGKIVEERLMRSRKDVTIGQDFKKNTLVVPISNLPKSFPVFEVKGDHYVLNFTGDMDGKISQEGSVEQLSGLVGTNRVSKQKGGKYSLKLSPSARGRLQIGEVTLLFQFVTPPPARPRPALPASMRGGWLKGMDPYLAALIFVSALIQVGFVVGIQMKDWPRPKKLDAKIPDRFVKIVQKEKKKEKKPKKLKKLKQKEGEKEGPPTEDAEPKESPSPAPKNEPEKKEELSPEEQAAREAAKQRQVAKDVENKTILGQIGAMSDDGEGSVANVLEEGAGEKSMEKAFANSEGMTTSAGEKSGLPTSGSSDAEGTGKAAGIGELGKTSGAKKAAGGVGTGDKSQEKVKARVNLKTPETTAGTGTLDSGSIRSTIKRYSGRIQRCYERQLKVDSAASGKVVVNFTIGRAGRVTQSRAMQDTVGGGVGSCVAQVIKGLRFRRPKGGEVIVNKTFVFEAGG